MAKHVGRDNLRQWCKWHWRGILSEIDNFGRLASMEQQRFRLIQRKKFLVLQSFRESPVGTPSTRFLFLPEHQISVLARAGDKFRGFRKRNCLNLVRVA